MDEVKGESGDRIRDLALEEDSNWSLPAKSVLAESEAELRLSVRLVWKPSEPCKCETPSWMVEERDLQANCWRCKKCKKSVSARKRTFLEAKLPLRSVVGALCLCLPSFFEPMQSHSWCWQQSHFQTFDAHLHGTSHSAFAQGICHQV